MEWPLNGRRVPVSGGSRGIGRAIVEAFLAEGAQGLFCARNADGVVASGTAIGAGLLVDGSLMRGVPF